LIPSTGRFSHRSLPVRPVGVCFLRATWFRQSLMPYHVCVARGCFIAIRWPTLRHGRAGQLVGPRSVVAVQDNLGRLCWMSTWRATLRRPRIRVGGPRSVVAVQDNLGRLCWMSTWRATLRRGREHLASRRDRRVFLHTAARPSTGAVWLKPRATLGQMFTDVLRGGSSGAAWQQQRLTSAHPKHNSDVYCS